jgi:hypothetical protein
VVLAACGTPEIRHLQPGDHELMVMAVVSRSGTIEGAATFWDSQEPVSLHVDAEQGQRAVVFAISADDLISPNGEPLPEEMLQGVSAGVGLTGGCGRCLAPTHLAPQLVSPGDLCVLPAFARVVEQEEPPSSEIVQRVRSTLELRWPGECACSASSESDSPSRDFEVIDPLVDSEVFSLGATLDDGDVALFAIDRALRIEANGRKTLVEDIPGVEGPVLAVTEVADGYVLGTLVSAERGLPTVKLIVLGRDLSLRAELTTSVTDLEALRYFPEVDLVAVAGGRPGSGIISLEDSAILLTCRADVAGASLECANVIADTNLANREFRDVIRLESGVVVGLAKGRRVLLLEELPAPASFRFRGSDSEGEIILPDDRRVRFAFHDFAVVPQGEDRPLGYGGPLGAVGDRIALCGNASDGAPSLGYLVSARATVDLRLIEPEVHACVRTRVEGDSTSCSSLFLSSPDRLRVHFRGRGFLELSADGTLVSGPETCPGAPLLGEEAEGLDVAPDRFIVSGSGRRLAFDVGGGVHLKASQGSGYQRLYGAANGRRHSAAAIRADEVWSFDRGSTFLVQDFGAVTSSRSFARPLPSEPSLAAYVERTDAFFLARTSEDGWLVRLDPETLEWEHLPIEGLRGEIDGLRAVGSNLLLLTSEAALYSYHGSGELRPVPIAWDLPDTDDVEDAPSKGCAGTGPLRALGSRGGVAWVGGCNGLLLRTLPTKEGYRAESIGTFGLQHDLEEKRGIVALAASCADQVTFAQSHGGSRADIAVYDVSGPSFTEEGRPGHRYPSPYPRTGVRGISVHDDQLNVVHSESLLTWVDRVTDGRVERWALTDRAEPIFGDDGLIVLTTRNGRLIVGRP